MSPELAQVEKHETGAESVKGIKAGLEANYSSAILGTRSGNLALSLRPDIKIMKECKNEDDGMVYQGLKMVINAGGELFSVVDVAVGDKTEGYRSTTVLTRRVEGDRAEIVGFIEAGDEALVVGRTDDRIHKMDLSRKHFTIWRSPEDGHIDIMDTKSSNGTDIFVSLDNNTSPTGVPDPTEDLSLWSVKSSKLKSAVLATT